MAALEGAGGGGKVVAARAGNVGVAEVAARAVAGNVGVAEVAVRALAGEVTAGLELAKVGGTPAIVAGEAMTVWAAEDAVVRAGVAEAGTARAAKVEAVGAKEAGAAEGVETGAVGAMAGEEAAAAEVETGMAGGNDPVAAKAAGRDQVSRFLQATTDRLRSSQPWEVELLNGISADLAEAWRDRRPNFR